MARFSPEILQQIRDRVSVVDVVRSAVPTLKKKGAHWWACCPFHSEKSPSFHVREREGHYHCFGCGAHGDIFTFVHETRGGSFLETVEHLAGMAGVKLLEDNISPEDRKRRTDGMAALSAAGKYFQRNLNDVTKKYIKQRKLTAETVAQFGLGYSDDNFNSLTNVLGQEGFSAEVLVETGLQVQLEEKGKRPYDRFRGRLMFPIHNLKDEIVGFGGRVMGEGEPKYLNSPETPFFSKRNVVYNLNRARDNVRKEDRLLLVEGYMDAVALWQAGIKTAVAPMGTAVTPEQIQMLWRYHDIPTVCLDGDDAGHNAARRLAQRVLPVLKPGNSLKFCLLEGGEDPDSFINKHGVNAFINVLKNTLSLEDVLWQVVSEGKNLNNSDNRASIEQEISSITSQIEDETVKRHYTRGLKDRLWRAGRNNKSAKPNFGMGTATKGMGGTPTSQEENLLGISLRMPDVLQKNEEKFIGLSFKNHEDKAIHNLLVRLLSATGVESEVINAHLVSSGLQERADVLTNLPAVKEFFEQGCDALLIEQHWLTLCQEILARKRKAGLLQSAKEAFEANPTPENWSRLQQAQSGN